MQNEEGPPCPICCAPMERFTVTRARTGDMQGIRCPECKTSSFLSREAVERLDTLKPVAKQVSGGVSPPLSDTPKEPTSLFEAVLAWLFDEGEETPNEQAH